MLNISKAASGLEDFTRDPANTTFPTGIPTQLNSGLRITSIVGSGSIRVPALVFQGLQIQFTFAGDAEIKNLSFWLLSDFDGIYDGECSATMTIYNKSGQQITSKTYTFQDEHDIGIYYRSDIYFSRIILDMRMAYAQTCLIQQLHWS